MNNRQCYVDSVNCGGCGYRMYLSACDGVSYYSHDESPKETPKGWECPNSGKKFKPLNLPLIELEA